MKYNLGNNQGCLILFFLKNYVESLSPRQKILRVNFTNLVILSVKKNADIRE